MLLNKVSFSKGVDMKHSYESSFQEAVDLKMEHDNLPSRQVQ